MRIAVVLGTRPEIIKMSPVVKEMVRKEADFFILHTGQHYSYELDEAFFEQLQLPRPKYNLGVGSGSHAEETGKMLIGIERVFLDEKPNIVLVEGDTNSVLAGALAATKLLMKVGHIEAGLRSYDRNMPEETNRILTDHCSDYLFAPTEKAKAVLLHEGLAEEEIFVTGNTIVDAVSQTLAVVKERGPHILNNLQLNPGEYFLVTVHRQENVDDRSRFASILEGLDRVAGDFNLPVVYPMHPRARKRLNEFHLRPRRLRLIDALDFVDFIELESNARLILTDSGGVQEESCILRVPCVTLRDNTERPETLEVGANILAGSVPDKILECSQIMLRKGNNWSNPFGDGKAGEKIVRILLAKESDSFGAQKD